MSDPLEQLSDSDLQALANDDLHSMSDEGLKVVASGASAPPAAAPQPSEPIGHRLIRQGLPLAGTIGGGLLGEGVASIPLAAAGNVAGSEGAQWLNHKIYGDAAPTYNSLDDAKRIGTEGAEGAMVETGGKLLGAGANMAMDAMAPAAAKTAESVAPMISKEVDTGLLDASGNPLSKTVQEAAPVAPPPAPKPGIGAKIGQFVKDHATDAIATTVGGLAGGIPGAVAAPIVKRAIGSAVEKPVALAVDGVAKVLSSAPSYFGKWAPSLTAAASRGTLSLNASVYILQQQDPEFRQKLQDLNGGQPATEAGNGNLP